MNKTIAKTIATIALLLVIMLPQQANAAMTLVYNDTTDYPSSDWGNKFYDAFNGSGYGYVEYNITVDLDSAIAGSAMKLYWDSTQSSHGNEDAYLEWQTTDYSMKYEPDYDRTITGIVAGKQRNFTYKVNYTGDSFIMCSQGAACTSSRAFTDNGNGYFSVAWGASGQKANITNFAAYAELGSGTTTVTVISPTSGTTNITNTTINFSASTTVGSIDKLWYYNGSSNITFTAGVPQYINLSNGTYTYRFYANNTNGIIGNTNVTWTINLTTSGSTPVNYTFFYDNAEVGTPSEKGWNACFGCPYWDNTSGYTNARAYAGSKSLLVGYSGGIVTRTNITNSTYPITFKGAFHLDGDRLYSKDIRFCDETSCEFIQFPGANEQTIVYYHASTGYVTLTSSVDASNWNTFEIYHQNSTMTRVKINGVMLLNTSRTAYTPTYIGANQQDSRSSLYLDELQEYDGRVKTLYITAKNVVDNTYINNFCTNISVITGTTSSSSRNFASVMNPSSTASGCSGKNWTACYDELLVSTDANGNVTRKLTIGGNDLLIVPWFSSSTACAVSNLQSGSNCNIGTVNFNQYCMVTDELSLVSMEKCAGFNQTDCTRVYNTINKINSSYGQLPGWRILVNETANTVLQCDSRTNSNCDTASDASVRLALAMFYGANNTRFTDTATQQKYLALAINLTNDIYKYEMIHSCYSSNIGSGSICEFPAGGANVKTGGLASGDYMYTGYYPEFITLFLLASQYNATYKAVAGNVTLNYLQAANWTGSGFKVPPGKSFKWVNLGGVPQAQCTNTCSPDQWDSVDAVRAFGLGESLYFANQMNVSLPNITAYMNQWHNAFLVSNNNSVVIQYYATGSASGSSQSGYFAQGLQSQAGIGTNNTLFNATVWNAINHYNSGTKTFDSTSCMGVYNAAPPLRSLASGIGLTAPAFGLSNEFVSINGSTTNSSIYCTTNGTIAYSTVGIWNITLFNISSNTYYTKNIYNYNLAANDEITIPTYQAILSITARQLFNNNTINNFSVTNNVFTNSTTTGTLLLFANNGTNNVQVNVPGNYSQNYTFTVDTPVTTTLVNATNIYDEIYTLGAKFLSDGVLNFNITVLNSTYDGVYYYQLETINGSVKVPVLQNYYYTFVLNSDTYADSNTTQYANNYIQTYNFSLYTRNTLNITFYDEQTGLTLNGTTTVLELISEPYSDNYTTTTGNIITNILIPTTYTMRYGALNYSTRFYQFSVQSDSYNELRLPMLRDSVATSVTVTVYDTTHNPLSDYIVKLLKYDVYTNSYQVNQIFTTNYAGQGVVTVQLNNEYYKFVVEKNNAVLLTTSPSYIYSNSVELNVNTGSNAFQHYFDSIGLMGNISYVPETSTINFFYADQDNIASQGCLVKKAYVNQRLLNQANICANGSTGYISMSIDNSTGNSYLFDGYVTKSNTTTRVSSLLQDFRSILESERDSKTGLFILVIFILLFVFIMFYNPSLAVIVIGAAPLIFTVVGFIALGYEIVVPIFLVSIVIAYILST